LISDHISKLILLRAQKQHGNYFFLNLNNIRTRPQSPP
jgi:hypothetical protein